MGAAASPGSLLLGRESQLGVLDQLLDDVHVRGGSVEVTGGPGVGKSALLGEAAARTADRGMLVLRVTGVQSEAWLAFAGLHYLLRPALGHLDQLAATRANPDGVANHGIDDVTNHYASFIDSLPAPPILIGHSFGGLIAEKLLGMNRGATAIGIDAAQIKGVLQLPLSQLRGTLSVFANPANRHKAVSLTAKEFRYSFGNALTEEESNALYERWTIPSPARPLFEGAAAAFSPHSPAKVDTANEDRGPLLLTMGGKDHTVPEVITKSTLKQYRHSDAVTDLVEFTDRGHSLTIDSGWREVAEACLAWLSKQGR